MPFTLTLEYQPDPTQNNSDLLIYAARWESAGRAPSSRRSWRFLLKVPSDEMSGELDLTSQYTAAFGAAPLGTQIPVKVVTINNDPPFLGGWASTPLYAFAVVTA